MQQKRSKILAFLFREWLLELSVVALVATSLWLKRLPVYSWEGVAPILLFFSLFVAAKGIEQSFLFQRIARRMEGGRFLPQKLVLLTFVISLIVSIDVSLVVMLPILFAMRIGDKIALAILMALTAHVGAALTPFGTPQNLFIFSYYHLDVMTFIRTMAPFTAGMGLFFLALSFRVKVKYAEGKNMKLPEVDRLMATVYLLLFGSVVLAIFGVVPVFVAVLPPLFGLLVDQRCLKVDYLLILTFLVFVGLADNVRSIVDVWIEHPHHIFLLTAGLSQIISNVPATLLLEKFTTQWHALLWGSNVGSFGTPIAAMANLIAYRLFLEYEPRTESKRYLVRFMLLGTVSFVLGCVLYLGYMSGWF